MTEETIVVNTDKVVVWTCPGWYVSKSASLKDTRHPRELFVYFNYDKFKMLASAEECREDGQMTNRPGFTINDVYCDTTQPEWLSEKPEVEQSSDRDLFEARLAEHQEFMQAYADCSFW